SQSPSCVSRGRGLLHTTDRRPGTTRRRSQGPKRSAQGPEPRPPIPDQGSRSPAQAQLDQFLQASFVRSHRFEAQAARSAKPAKARWTTRSRQSSPPFGPAREAPVVPRLQANGLPCLWSLPARLGPQPPDPSGRRTPQDRAFGRSVSVASPELPEVR